MAPYNALIPLDSVQTYPQRPSPSVEKGGSVSYPPLREFVDSLCAKEVLFA